MVQRVGELLEIEEGAWYEAWEKFLEDYGRRCRRGLIDMSWRRLGIAGG
ncbi:hypothetical protein [Pyrobaculum islandicum]|nr:hypothetical protein [Pyrobaculum islandicum]